MSWWCWELVVCCFVSFFTLFSTKWLFHWLYNYIPITANWLTTVWNWITSLAAVCEDKQTHTAQPSTRIHTQTGKKGGRSDWMKNVLTEKKHVLVEEQNREKEQMTDKEKCVLLKWKTKNRNKNRHIEFCFVCLTVSNGPLFLSLTILSTVCNCDLAQSGFFQKKGEYICTADYQRLYGTRCDRCDTFITGEVVSALGRTYHPKCFVCSVCRYVYSFSKHTHNTIYKYVFWWCLCAPKRLKKSARTLFWNMNFRSSDWWLPSICPQKVITIARRPTVVVRILSDRSWLKSWQFVL